MGKILANTLLGKALVQTRALEPYPYVSKHKSLTRSPK